MLDWLVHASRVNDKLIQLLHLLSSNNEYAPQAYQVLELSIIVLKPKKFRTTYKILAKFVCYRLSLIQKLKMAKRGTHFLFFLVEILLDIQLFIKRNGRSLFSCTYKKKGLYSLVHIQLGTRGSGNLVL